MRNFKFQIENGIWRLLIVLSTLFLISDMLKQSQVASLCFAGIYVVVALYLFFYIKDRGFTRKEFLLLSLIIFFSVFNVFYGAASISFQYCKKLILFLTTIIMMFVSLKFKPNEKTVRGYGISYQILAIVIFYKSFVNIDYYGTTKFSSLGLGNSNVAGMWIFLVFAVLLWEYYFVKKFKYKVAVFIELALLFYACILTGCRSALLSIIVLTVLSIFFVGTKRFDSFFLVGAVVIPVLFPWLYLYLYKINFSLTFTNKTLFSGRETIWENALKYVQSHPLYGAYYEISDGTGQSQMHNIFIDVMASYGIFVVILVWFLLFYLLCKMQKKIFVKAQHLIFFAFLLVLVEGTFEAAFFSGGSGIGVASCMFFSILNYEKNVEKTVIVVK